MNDDGTELDPEVFADPVDSAKSPQIIDVNPDAEAAGASGGLAPYDPFRRYMAEIKKYPALSREEEQRLARHYRETGDRDALFQLVTANLMLVVRVAFSFRRAAKNLLDLVQEGNIGLMQAVRKYDPYKGVKLSSYAAWWIRAYMLRYILNNHRLVKVGTTQAQRKLFFNLQKEKARLSAMGIEPTAEVIAERLNVPERDVVSMDMRLAAGDASLDVPVGTSEGRSVARVELLPSEDVRVDDTLADAELGDQFSTKIHEFGKALVDKEKKIFEDRLVAEDPKTLQTLGDEFGVSRERVRQIEKRLLGKLKDFLHKELGDTVVDVYESP